MNDSFNSNVPEPKKVGVWAEGTHIEAKLEYRDGVSFCNIMKMKQLYGIHVIKYIKKNMVKNWWHLIEDILNREGEYIIPKKSPDSSDDIPTIPDLDDLQDILEKEISTPTVTDRKDTDTVNTLAEVGGGLSASADSADAALEILKSYIPQVELETADSVWTIDSLLTQLVEESSPVL